MKAKGHSLWLMPENETYQKFSSLIQQLANMYNGPIFKPHITLLGEVLGEEEIIVQKAQELASAHIAFPVQLENVAYEDYYFRALFVRAEKTAPLQQLHDDAKRIFDMEAIPYMPHVSLLYGDYPKEIKEDIIKTIGEKQPTQLIIKNIYVYKTNGTATEWEKVAVIPLG